MNARVNIEERVRGCILISVFRIIGLNLGISVFEFSVEEMFIYKKL